MTPFRLILFLISFASYTAVHGQTSSEHLDTLVGTYVDELRAKNIDTICIYQDYCVGCIYNWKKREDECDFQGLFVSTYILWLDKGKTFMTKKDNCFDYSAIEIPTDSIWSFYLNNQDTIKLEELKIPQYFELKNGKQELFCSTVDHSYHQAIKIIVGQNTIIDKDLDDYYLSKDVGFSGRKNINYEYNINSRLKNFQLLIDRTIKNTTKVNPLTKTRR